MSVRSFARCGKREELLVAFGPLLYPSACAVLKFESCEFVLQAVVREGGEFVAEGYTIVEDTHDESERCAIGILIVEDSLCGSVGAVEAFALEHLVVHLEFCLLSHGLELSRRAVMGCEDACRLDGEDVFPSVCEFVFALVIFHCYLPVGRSQTLSKGKCAAHEEGCAHDDDSFHK